MELAVERLLAALDALDAVIEDREPSPGLGATPMILSTIRAELGESENAI